MTNPLYAQILTEVERLLEAHAALKQPTYGRDLIDFPPDALIMEAVKLPVGDDELEIGATTAAARPAYEWLFELTIRRADSINHFLLQPNQQLVEAYGRDVFEADAVTSQSLLDYLSAVS